MNGGLQSNETKEIQVNIFVPLEVKESYQIVMFRLRHPQTGYLGQALVGMIRLPAPLDNKSSLPQLDDD